MTANFILQNGTLKILPPVWRFHDLTDGIAWPFPPRVGAR